MNYNFKPPFPHHIHHSQVQSWIEHSSISLYISCASCPGAESLVIHSSRHSMSCWLKFFILLFWNRDYAIGHDKAWTLPYVLFLRFISWIIMTWCLYNAFPVFYLTISNPYFGSRLESCEPPPSVSSLPELKFLEVLWCSEHFSLKDRNVQNKERKYNTQKPKKPTQTNSQWLHYSWRIVELLS